MNPTYGNDVKYTKNGTNLRQLFYPYTSGTKSATTGYQYNGSDLNNIFQNKNSPPWSALGSGLNSNCYAIARDSNNNVYVGGNFTIPASYIAKWDGNNWSALGSGLNGTCWAIAIDSNNNVYAGGAFTSPGFRIAKWDGNNWYGLGNGFNSTCYAIAINSVNNVYAGGDFTTAGGNPANRIANWNGLKWNILGSSTSNGVNDTCRAIAIDSNYNVYVGGSFIQVSVNTAGTGGFYSFYTAIWNGSWNRLSGFTNPCFAIGIDSNNNVYAGGDSACGILKLSGSGMFWIELGLLPGNGVNGTCWAIAFDSNNNVYAGGSFTSAGVITAGNGTISASRIVKWNGNWSALGSGLSSTCYAIKIISNNVYAGGNFTTADGISARRIAKCKLA